MRYHRYKNKSGGYYKGRARSGKYYTYKGCLVNMILIMFSLFFLASTVIQVLQ